jgi:hypothetical protein
MKVTMLVTMERPNSYDGKKGHVDQRIIALQDAERYAATGEMEWIHWRR